MRGVLLTSIRRIDTIYTSISVILKSIACYLRQFIIYYGKKHEKEVTYVRTISIRLNDADYEKLDEILDSMGQTKQTFYETYTNTVLRLRRIPFAIEAAPDPFYSESNVNRLKHSFQQESEGKVVRKTVAELEAMEERE